MKTLAIIAAVLCILHCCAGCTAAPPPEPVTASDWAACQREVAQRQAVVDRMPAYLHTVNKSLAQGHERVKQTAIRNLKRAEYACARSPGVVKER